MALSNSSNTLHSSKTENLGRLGSLRDDYFDTAQAYVSAVSWPAIFAGAAAAATLSLILLLLGLGLGLSSISPWIQKGVSASSFGVSTIIWITVTQVTSSGMGGYLAGRLRVRWAGPQVDEVYFRDTAHGFLAWSVATLATAVLLTSAIGGILSGGFQAATTLTASATNMVGNVAAANSDQVSIEGANGIETGLIGYFVDSLFRKNTDTDFTASTDPSLQLASATEVTRILVNAIRMKSLPPADLSYTSKLVSTHTGLNDSEAEQRVNSIYNTIQEKVRNAEIATKYAADKARKISIYTTLWLFVSLLMGAFSASLAATYGGRCRDA